MAIFPLKYKFIQVSVAYPTCSEVMTSAADKVRTIYELPKQLMKAIKQINATNVLKIKQILVP